MTTVPMAGVTVHEDRVYPDSARTLLRFHAPSGAPEAADNYAWKIIRRILAIAPGEAEALAAEVIESFSPRHPDLLDSFAHTARVLTEIYLGKETASPAHLLLMVACFTSEISMESAAICNPSAVVHADQSGLAEGELRVAVATRGIGEGHISSIGFAEAIVSATSWRFLDRSRPLSSAVITEGPVFDPVDDEETRRIHRQWDLARTNVGELPEGDDRWTRRPTTVGSEDRRPAEREGGDGAESMLRSDAPLYRASFNHLTTLSQRVLSPALLDEAHGMEDARFTLFRTRSGGAEYRATYTAFDGHRTRPRIIVSSDLRTFEMHDARGSATVDKGLALFPRVIGDRLCALTRVGMDSIALATSADGTTWEADAVIYQPREWWDLAKAGNCGSPIEIQDGWLVITHGASLMRRYAISAMVLDRDDPSIVKRRLRTPILNMAAESPGYVPNVLYSCGSIVHRDRLWIPYSETDDHVRIASVPLETLLSAMTSEAR